MAQVITTPPRTDKYFYTVNVRLLMISVAIAAVTAVGAYGWYQYRLGATASTFLDRAEKLSDEGEWAEAANYYQRYLLVDPENTDVLVALVKVFAKGEPNPRKLSQLNGLLYRTLGRLPERHDLRQMLAENLLKTGALEEAAREAEKIRGGPPEVALAARKVIAIAQIHLAEVDHTIAIAGALEELIAVAKELPGDPELSLITAASIRKYPAELPATYGDPATLADSIVDEAVAANPNNIAARLARYRYRLQHALPGGEEDLKVALEIAPDNSDALLYSAVSKLADQKSPQDLDAADGQLRRAIELAPYDTRAYLALAELLKRQNRPEDAILLLQDALRIADNRFEVGLALGVLQLQSKQVDEASATLKQLETDKLELFARLGKTEKDQVENRLRLFSAQISLVKSELGSAEAQLKSIYLEGEATPALRSNVEWVQATQLLARAYESRGEWDQASRYWDSLLRVSPNDPEIVSLAVGAALKAGNAIHAAELINQLQRSASLSPQLLVKQVQTQLILQMQRAPGERNWTEFREALNAAKSEIPGSWELVFAEFEHAKAEAAVDGTLLAILRNAEERLSTSKEFWRNACLQYALLDATDDKTRALGRYKELEESASRKILFESTLLQTERKFAEADRLLSEAATSLTGADQRAVQRGRLDVLVQVGDLQSALKLAQNLISANPADPELLAVAAELAMASGNSEVSRQLEERLGAVTSNGIQARTLKIKRLLAGYPDLSEEQRQDLQDEVIAVRSERPRWYQIVSIAARLSELKGDKRRAVEDYRLAVDLGDRRPFTLQQLVTLLYELDLVREADHYLAMLAVDPASAAFADSFGIDMALKQGQPDEAIELAEQSVKRYPSDSARRLYLANLHLAYGSLEESEAVLRKALQDFPKDSTVWTALVTFLAKNERSTEAAELLDSVSQSKEIGPQQRYAIMAQGYEAIGNVVSAIANYQRAIEGDPGNVQLRMRVARLLVPRSVKGAQIQYEQVLQLDPANIEAQRQLAVLLASTGNPADWTRATQLLESVSSRSSADASTNDRLRALLISKQGRTRSERIAKCQAARDILEKQLDNVTQSEADLCRLLLAQIIEQQATLSGDNVILTEARDHLKAVVDRDSPPVERLSLYIEFLLRNASKVHQLTLKDPAQSDGEGDGASLDLREEFLVEAEEYLARLRRHVSDKDLGVDALATALSARILQARGNVEEAKSSIGQFVANHEQSELSHDSAQFALAVGQLYSLLEEHAAAEEWYRRVMKLKPNAYVLVVQSLLAQDKGSEAARLCLELSPNGLSPEMAQMLANVMASTSAVGDDVYQEADAALQDAVRKYGGNVGLLQAEAYRKASLGDYESAISGYSQVIKVDPQNSSALNNLATLLAEKPNRRAEALKLVQQAIQLAGRQPALLDTEGTIYLKMGQPDQAIASLEEATAGGVADARYYLHLAAAYQLAQRERDALQMLKEARAFGLDQFLLTEDDKKFVEQLDKALNESAAATRT